MGQKEIDAIRAQWDAVIEADLRDALGPVEPFGEPGDWVNPETHPEMVEGWEPWNTTFMLPSGIEKTVETEEELRIYLQQSGEKLEDFLKLPKTRWARDTRRFSWLEGLYASAGL